MKDRREMHELNGNMRKEKGEGRWESARKRKPETASAKKPECVE